MRLCVGYEFVCPDGAVRCFPYHNEGDAACDARVREVRGCRVEQNDPPSWGDPPCPGGRHRVRAVTLAHAERARGVA